jgi:WD40 repeat protein
MKTIIKLKKIFEYAGHSQNIYTLAYYPQEESFLSGGGDGYIALWNTKTGENRGALLRAGAPVYALAAIPSRNLLIVGQNDGGIHFYDLKEKKLIKSMAALRFPIFNFCWIPGSNSVFAAVANGYFLCLDIDSFTCAAQFDLKTQNLRCIAYSQAQELLAIGGSDALIRIYRYPNLELLQVLKRHTNSVFTLSFSNCGNFLYSSGRDCVLAVWETRNFSLAEAIAAHHYTINHLALSPSGAYLATASMDSTVKLWEVSTLKLLKVIDQPRFQGHSASVNRLLWLPDGQLISAGDDRKIYQWEFERYEFE